MVLTGDQFKQLKKISENNHDLLNGIIKFLNSKTLESLEASDVCYLKEESVRKLDDRIGHRHLIQAIENPALLSLLDNKLLNHITPQQVKLLNREDWYKLEKPELLVALKNVGWSKDLTDVQKDQIKLHLIENYGSFLDSEAQGIAKIEPWHVIHLPENAFSMLSRVELIRFIPPAFYSILTHYQAGLLNGKDKQDEIIVKNLSYPALIGIKPYFYNQLTSGQISQLQSKDKNIISQLEANEVVHLSDAALQAISRRIIGNLTSNTVRRLTSPTLLLCLSDDQLGQITDKQKEIIKKTLDEDIKQNNSSNLEIDKIKNIYLKFLSDQYISQVSTKKIPYLSDKQWHYLSSDQIHSALKEGIIQDKKRFISALNINALENIKGLKNSKIASLIGRFLTNNQVSLLNETQHKDLIQSISSSQLLRELTNQALQEITPAQIHLLETYDLKRLTSISLLLTIPASRLQDLTQDQKNIIKSHISNMKANEVPIHYFNYLSNFQIKMLKDKKSSSET